MTQTNDFFQARPDVKPMIYAFELIGVPDHKGYLKVGYTDKQTPEDRVRQIMHTSAVPYRIVFKESAMKRMAKHLWIMMSMRCFAATDFASMPREKTATNGSNALKRMFLLP